MNGNAINSLASSLYSAVIKDLSDIAYPYRKPGQDISQTVKRTRRPRIEECEVVMFNQLWGSTALGFGGIGGAAMTNAYTVIIFSDNRTEAAVYFGGGFAYLVKQPNAEFHQDVASQHVKGRTVANDGTPVVYVKRI